MITVVLIDDHDLVRAGLEQLLGAAPGISVVTTGADGSFADEIVRSLRGVRTAHEGGSPLDPRVAVTLVQHRRATDSAADSLTPREREVLECVAEGLPNKLIARRLGIAERTVKAHLTRVFSVLGVTDRTQAALWAREHGLSAVPA